MPMETAGRRPIRLHLTAIAAALLLSAVCNPVAAYTPPGKQEKAVKSDIQYIRCLVADAACPMHTCWTHECRAHMVLLAQMRRL